LSGSNLQLANGEVAATNARISGLPSVIGGKQSAVPPAACAGSEAGTLNAISRAHRRPLADS